MEGDRSHRKTLLKPAEAAARLGVPLRTVYIWCELGVIEGININGKSLRIFYESVSKQLEMRPYSGEQNGIDGLSMGGTL